MIEAADGLVIRYSYLWAREFSRSEESGRKDRPVCVQIVVKNSPLGTRVVLFPITSAIPREDQTALSIPKREAKLAQLKTPAWIVIDEFNIDNLATSPHIADTEPLGKFSDEFMHQIRRAAVELIRSHRYRQVPRI